MMKNKIFTLFLLIPIVASCNKDNKGFVDPFPDDSYVKIGFAINESEKIETSLNQKDRDLITFTIENPTLYENITKEEIMIRERDYSRAFAGEFKSGYSSSNKMVNEDSIIFRQKATSSLKKRKEIRINSNAIYDYYYGRNSVATKYNNFIYLAEEVEGIEHKEYEECGIEDAKYTIEQRYINDELSSYEKLLEKKDPNEDGWDEPSFLISQKDYIFNVNDATVGANRDKEIVLIKEQQIPYKSTNDEGDYVLSDGRKFRATINSLKVIKLKRVTAEINGKDVEWLLVKYARIYSEIAITSDEIHPNVPITTLKNPIVINYKEEIHNFYIGDIEEKSTEVLPNVPVVETIK